MLTIRDALARADNIPADKANNNCVRDGAARVREACMLALSGNPLDARAPSYVLRAVDGLQSWIDHKN